jgi:hypothetical protein
LGFEAWGLGGGVEDLGFRVESLGFRFSVGVNLRVQVQGLRVGFRV